MTPEERRDLLIVWLSEVWWIGATASRIVGLTRIYDDVRHAQDRCFDDLLVLAKRGVVVRNGRPARWKLA